MDRKIALKWAKALESGEYEQMTGGLRGSSGFCCLGVLCNLHAQAHPEIAAEQDDHEVYMGEEAGLPEHVMNWAGMESSSGTFTHGFRYTFKNPHNDRNEIEDARSLVDLNDDYELDFDHIAKVLRKHSDKL